MSGVSNEWRERSIKAMVKVLCEDGGDCIGCYDCECPITEYCKKLYKAGYRLCPKRGQTIEEKTEIGEIFGDIYSVMDTLISANTLARQGTDGTVSPRYASDLMVSISVLKNVKNLIEIVEKKYIKE